MPVSTRTDTSYDLASVAVNADGKFIVVWAGVDAVSPDGAEIFARRSLANGDPIGAAEFRVNDVTATSGQQSVPSAAYDAQGNHVVYWMSENRDGSDYGVVAQRFDAGGDLVGGEIRVNTFTVGEQTKRPSVSTVVYDPQGNLVFVWQSKLQDGSGTGVYADKFYLPNQGPPLDEFRVNTTTTGNQSEPSVAMSGTGRAVVVWSTPDGDGSGITAQRFDFNGRKIGSEIQVNATTIGEQFGPVVATNKAGDFAGAWISNDGSQFGIFAKVFNADGTVKKSEFRANTVTTGNQHQHAIAMADDGRFVVVWTSVGQDGDGDGIYGQLYNTDGIPFISEIHLAQRVAGPQALASVAMMGNGDFVVAWVGNNPNGPQNDLQIFARYFDVTGAPRSDEITVNSTASGQQFLNSIGLDAAGNAVIVWMAEQPFDGQGYGIFVQRLNSAGQLVGPNEVPVNSQFQNDQSIPSIAVASNGNAVVLWTTGQYQTGFYDGIFCRRLSPTLARIGSEFQLNQTTFGIQRYGQDKRIAMDSKGNYLAAWASENQDGSGYGIYATKVFVPTLPTIVSAVSSNPTGDGVTLTGVVDPGSTATQVHSEFGRTSNLEAMPTPWQPIGDGHEDVPVSVALTGLDAGSSYFFQLVAKNDQGPEVRSALLTFSTAPAIIAPAVVPPGSATLQVNLTPATARWRILGETSWRRNSNDPNFVAAVDNASGLAVASEYVIEFEPQGGPVPLPQTVRLAGGLNQATAAYPAGVAELGKVAVVIHPAAVADALIVEQRGQWRFLGESDAQWRNSAVEVERPAGTYVIEFKPLNGRTKVPNRGITVQAGRTVTLTNFYENPATVAGTLPQGLSLPDATTMEPYFLAGQVQTDIGDGSGHVVQERVVLTAGHVVFDDQALSTVTTPIADTQLSTYAASGIRWRFQRMRGQLEPVPIEPRGSYVLRGYAAARSGVARARARSNRKKTTWRRSISTCPRGAVARAAISLPARIPTGCCATA